MLTTIRLILIDILPDILLHCLHFLVQKVLQGLNHMGKQCNGCCSEFSVPMATITLPIQERMKPLQWLSANFKRGTNSGKQDR